MVFRKEYYKEFFNLVAPRRVSDTDDFEDDIRPDKVF